jgi:hypothetical protein
VNEPAWLIRGCSCPARSWRSTSVVGAAVLALSSGVPGIFLGRTSRVGERIAVAVLAASAILGLARASMAALADQAPAIDLPWLVPGGGFSVSVDPISALFLAPIFFVGVIGSIYGQTTVAFFGRALRPATHDRTLHGVFPSASSFESHVDDAVLGRIVVPATRSTVRAFGWFRWVERGNSQLYIVLILVAIVATFVAAWGGRP